MNTPVFKEGIRHRSEVQGSDRISVWQDPGVQGLSPVWTYLLGGEVDGDSQSRMLCTKGTAGSGLM